MRTHPRHSRATKARLESKKTSEHGNRGYARIGDLSLGMRLNRLLLGATDWTAGASDLGLGRSS